MEETLVESSSDSMASLSKTRQKKQAFFVHCTINFLMALFYLFIAACFANTSEYRPHVFANIIFMAAKKMFLVLRNSTHKKTTARQRSWRCQGVL